IEDGAVGSVDVPWLLSVLEPERVTHLVQDAGGVAEAAWLRVVVVFVIKPGIALRCRNDIEVVGSKSEGRMAVRIPCEAGEAETVGLGEANVAGAAIWGEHEIDVADGVVVGEGLDRRRLLRRVERLEPRDLV